MADIEAAEIGEPNRTEPLQVPAPQKEPAPVERPVEAPPKREEVPA